MVSDILMPFVGSPKLVRRLHERDQDLPVLLVSPPYRLPTMLKVRLLPKPFDAERLVRGGVGLAEAFA